MTRNRMEARTLNGIMGIYTNEREKETNGEKTVHYLQETGYGIEAEEFIQRKTKEDEVREEN
jgi:hypothetical protein